MSMLKELQDTQRTERIQTDNKIWNSKKVGVGMFAHLEGRFEKPTTKSTSERASLLEPFVKRLQSNTGGYRPLTKAYICSMMAYIKTEELYEFYQKLHESPNFGAIWNWYCVAKDLNSKNK
jgi:hypothetical protein